MNTLGRWFFILGVLNCTSVINKIGYTLSLLKLAAGDLLKNTTYCELPYLVSSFIKELQYFLYLIEFALGLLQPITRLLKLIFPACFLLFACRDISVDSLQSGLLHVLVALDVSNNRLYVKLIK